MLKHSAIDTVLMSHIHFLVHWKNIAQQRGHWQSRLFQKVSAFKFCPFLFHYFIYINKFRGNM